MPVGRWCPEERDGRAGDVHNTVSRKQTLAQEKQRSWEYPRMERLKVSGESAVTLQVPSGQVKLSGLVALWCISCSWGQSILCVLLLGEELRGEQQLQLIGMGSLPLPERFGANSASTGHLGSATLVPWGAGGTRAGGLWAGPARRNSVAPRGCPGPDILLHLLHSGRSRGPWSRGIGWQGEVLRSKCQYKPDEVSLSRSGLVSRLATHFLLVEPPRLAVVPGRPCAPWGLSVQSLLSPKPLLKVWGGGGITG